MCNPHESWSGLGHRTQSHYESTRGAPPALLQYQQRPKSQRRKGRVSSGESGFFVPESRWPVVPQIPTRVGSARMLAGTAPAVRIRFPCRANQRNVVGAPAVQTPSSTRARSSNRARASPGKYKATRSSVAPCRRPVGDQPPSASRQQTAVTPVATVPPVRSSAR